MRDANRPLTEPAVLKIVQSLREKGATVIALTSMNTGKVGFYNRLEVWRYDHLKSLGFVGDHSDLEFVFSDFERQPIFFKGILAADLEDKGQVLGSFLNKTHLNPTNIIAIDDDIQALRSIEKYCLNHSIPFKGYLYTGHQAVPWNQDVIDFQATYLLKKKEWLDDEEAFKKIQNQK